jgi:hypothetical protein
MQKMRLFRTASTNEAVVFASSSESQFEKKVLTARAKRRERVDNFLESAKDEDKKKFIEALFDLNATLVHHATVSERLLIFIDNNVIQDILKRDKAEEPVRRARFHALLALLMLAEDYYLIDIFACISPAVLYEAAGRGTRPVDEVYAEVLGAIAEAGLAMHTIGFNHLNELKNLFKKIRKDESEIRSALNKIKMTSWERDFSPPNKFGTRIPFSLAEEECPNVRLTYFSPGYVKFLLMHIIEKRMFSENSEKAEARKLMQNPQEKAFTILKLKGDGVEGLGDIELLEHCDLRLQTMKRTPHITMGLTFDGSLRDALRRHAHVQSRVTVVGGIDDLSDSATRVTYSMLDSQRRTEKANKRVTEYHSAFKKFLEVTLRRHFSASVDRES